ncbi:uncharacterized protein METZ01_LOCUS433653 [marine metagenome]|uniref:Uncharacterized protein n=1 Tax=marine metagenome TaxID=408172 RepID=A0A382YCT1_9ZZZZ
MPQGAGIYGDQALKPRLRKKRRILIK